MSLDRAISSSNENGFLIMLDPALVPALILRLTLLSNSSHFVSTPFFRYSRRCLRVSLPLELPFVFRGTQ